MAAKKPEVIIVAGEVNSGKTGVLRTLVAREKERGNVPTGIIAPGVYRDGNKIGFDVIDVPTGQSVSLARTSWDQEDGLSAGRFVFSNRGFAFACDALRQSRPGGVVFIDEVGPIELGGGGHAHCLRRLLNSDISRLYISVRNECVDKVIHTFLASHKVKILNVEEFIDRSVEARPDNDGNGR